MRHGGYLVGSPSRKMRVPEIFFFYLIGPIWWLKNPRFFKNYSGVISTYIGSLTSLHALPAKVSLVSLRIHSGLVVLALASSSLLRAAA